MRVLVAWADDRSPNLGVRALAHGSAALVRQALGDCEVDFQNFGRGAAPVPLGSLRSLVRENVDRRAVRDWIAGYDLVVDTRSGDSFADIYGTRRLATMTLLAETARRVGVPVVLGPQTIGPFESGRGRALARRSLRTARVVMARDGASADASARLGRPVDLLTTDVVFALPVPQVPTTRDVVLNVSGLLWHDGPHVDSSAYRAAVDEVCRGLLESGRRVTLLAHVLDSPRTDNDVPAVEAVAAAHPDVDVVVPADLDEVRRVVASARLVIGSRMHACLNALSVGVPAVPMAYSRKFAPLLDALGWSRTVDLRSSTTAGEDVLKIAGDPSLADDAADVRHRAQELLAPAADLLRATVGP